MIRAADPKPNEASIKQLLNLMQLHNGLDAIAAQMNKLMETAAQQASQGKPLPPVAKASVARCRADVRTLIKEGLAWEKMEPVYIEIYQNAFTQEEVDAMIAFYKTPVGQSLVVKLPVAIQNAQNQTMQMVRPIMQRIQEMQQEVAEAEKAGK